MRALPRVLAACAILAIVGAKAEAQIIGTFSWQTQPYCNRVTLTVVQQGGIFQLTGADDLCGAGIAPVTGTAVVTGSGVAFGFTVALATGRAAHVSASVNLATVSGTWADADGNVGTFVFNGAAGGSPRPAPTASSLILPVQLSPTIYAGTGSATTLARSDHDHDARYYTKAEIDGSKTASVAVTNILGGPFPAYTFVPEGTLAFTAQTVTTDRPGRLLVSKMFVGAAVCSTPNEYLLFLVVDGVAVRSSAIYFATATATSTRLSGVTEAVLAAGVHTVAVGGECPGSLTLSIPGVTLISNTSVVVLP